MSSLYSHDTKIPRKLGSRVGNAIMKSYRFHVPKYDLPLRLRPCFLVLTCVVMVILAFLGFTDFSRALPLNDKLLHFMCFMIATGVFYFIVDIEETARRIWFWRYFNLIFTFFTCFLCGGILSEVVQSFLPYKEYQVGNVVANLLGSSIGLVFSYHLEKYYRRRREISRLYRPLESDSLSDFEDDLETFGTQLLPTHHSPHHNSSSNSRSPTTIADVSPFGIDGSHKATRDERKSKKGTVRFAPEVRDEREALFDIGDGSEGEEEEQEGRGVRLGAYGLVQERQSHAVLS